MSLSGAARVEVLYDPNPTVGVDESIEIRKEIFADEIGDLGYYFRVKGPGSGARPAVVVQYRARGFLRGGTGDEYPILPMVQQGSVVQIGRAHV
mgnify:FL=1